ncbi:Uncharacterised protein [Pasteurella dagmatis]|nr:Uncharacterised protein [Pasteurella dagmatis]
MPYLMVVKYVYSLLLYNYFYNGVVFKNNLKIFYSLCDLLECTAYKFM